MAVNHAQRKMAVVRGVDQWQPITRNAVAVVRGVDQWQSIQVEDVVLYVNSPLEYDGPAQVSVGFM